MGFRLSVLIPVLFLIFIFPMPALAGQSGCLACHSIHHSELGSCTACHRGNERTDRKRVAHDGMIPGSFAWFTIKGAQPVARGKKLLERYACRRCHSAEGRGNRLAANLDTMLLTRQPREIARSIEKPAQCMPDFRLADGEITDLVNAVLAGATPVAAKTGETPLVVHFAEEQKLNENIFEKLCGSCHRMLSEKFGGLGRGESGPNLSGILSPFYPKTLRECERWNVEILHKWLANPRRIRRNAQMPPVSLKEVEFRQLVDILKQGQ